MSGCDEGESFSLLGGDVNRSEKKVKGGRER